MYQQNKKIDEKVPNSIAWKNVKKFNFLYVINM